MLLIENVLGHAKIEESNRKNLPEGVLCRVTYPICNIGELNANNRMYERDVWEAVGKDESINEKMANRALFGQAEHPEETLSDLQLTSHVIFETWIDESDNKAYQRLDVLDTPMGRIIETLLKAGCGVGMSTRAEGDLEDVEGEMDEATGEKKTYQKVIAETYRYVTTDFTADPSTFGVAPQDLEFNLCKSVAKSTREGKMNLAEKKFVTKILKGIKCKECKCGEGKCKVTKCIAEMDEGSKLKEEAAEEEDTEIHTWFERDRAHVELRNSRTGETIVEWWDEEVEAAIEDGFLDPKDYHGSAFEYAKKMGLLQESKLKEYAEGSFKDWFAENENSDELQADYEQAKADMEEVDPDSVPDFKTWARARYDALQEGKVDEKQAPTCSKCNKAHWPFQKCGGGEKKADDSVDTDKEPEEKKAEESKTNEDCFDKDENFSTKSYESRKKLKEMALSNETTKYVVKAQAFDPVTKKATSVPREEEIDISENDIFNGCIAKWPEVTSIGDIEQRYEEYWNKLHRDLNQREQVKVISIIPVSESKTSEAKVDEGHGFQIGTTVKDREDNHYVVKGFDTDTVNLESAGGGVGVEKRISWQEANEIGLTKVAESKVNEEGTVKFKVVKGLDKVHRSKEGAVGEFIKILDDAVGIRFEDGKEMYFWPDEIEQVGGGHVELPERKAKKESVKTIANQFVDLQISEAITRAELESALDNIKGMPDWDIQCKILHEKLNVEVKKVTEQRELLEAKVSELSAVKDETEALRGILEKKSALVKETQKIMNETKKHQVSLDALNRQHQKELTECANDSILEGRKEIIEAYFNIKIEDHRLEVDDNSRALLENCGDLQEVDSLVDRLVTVARKSALHSRPFTSVEIHEAQEVVDPADQEADRVVGHLMREMR